MDLSLATVVVTGAGRGIGRAIALEFAAQGAQVALAARTGSEIEEVARQISAAGGTALALSTDVTDQRSVGQLMRRAEAELGSVDVLVNNAAIARSIGPLHETEPSAWMADIQVNLIGYYLCLHAALPPMLSRQRGYIIK